MHSLKRAAFSSNCEYFACVNSNDHLLIWDTLNNVFIDCKFDSSVYICSSLHWVPLRQKAFSPKKAKLTNILEKQLLAVGTVKGDILLYNIASKNLYLHLVGRHSDAINDMCFHNETDSFFTCSNDKSIAVWDISNGKQKSKWKAGDDPVSSLCVIDGNNILSSSTSIIIWWNVLEKKAIKTFNGHSEEIFKLLPVNAESLNSCYFLSGSVNDRKINTWSLNSNECETPVASFVLPEQLSDLDISNASSKDKPLVLSAVTKDGFLHLFEHVLNGNVNQPILPKVSMKITTKSPSPPVMCLKLSSDSESCTIAFGCSRDDMTFKHIKIRESLSESENKIKIPVNKFEDKLPNVTETSKTSKSFSINGHKSPSKCPENSKLKTTIDSVSSRYRRKLRSSSVGLSSTNTELEISHAEELNSNHNDRDYLKILKRKDPRSTIDMLHRGLQTNNEDIINAIFQNSDIELIEKCVAILPSSSLKLILHELNNRLCHQSGCSPKISKWIKEITNIHLNNIIQCDETTRIAQSIEIYLRSLKIPETISKMSALKGILSLATQISSSEESSSEDEDL